MASTTNRVMKPSEWEQLGLRSTAKKRSRRVATREGGWMGEKFYRIRQREKNVS
jgi:cytidylate kinase